MATKEREQEIMWDTAKQLIQEHHEDKAKVIVKKSIESSMEEFELKTPEFSSLNLTKITEEIIEQLRSMDFEVRNKTTKSSRNDYEKFENIFDYIKLISEVTDNPDISFKKMIASVLAEKSKKSQEVPHWSPMKTATTVTVKREDQTEDFYTTTEAAKKLGVSDQTIRRMCEAKKFQGAIRSDGDSGHWRIPQSNFITSKEHDKKKDEFLRELDRKNAVAGEVDEFNV